MKPELARALPKHMNPDRLARIALTVVRQSPDLAKCTSESFLGALMTCSQLGLEPGPLGEAYIVKYGNVATFIAGYRGFVKLAWQSGQISSIAAETVHEHDHFEVHYGSERRIVHDRPPLGTKRGKALGWYALASFKGGGEAFVVMDRDEVDAIRKRSRASGNGPWVTDYDAMAKKTCVRQLAKWLPLSAELTAVLGNDGRVRTDISEAALHAPTGPVVEGEIVTDTGTGEITSGPPAAPEGYSDYAGGDQGDVVDAELEDPPGWPEVAQPGAAAADDPRP